MADTKGITADHAEVHARVVDTLAGMLKRELGSLHSETRILDDLGLDSTNILELLMELEDAFEIEFDPDTFEPSHFETIGALVRYVAGQASEQT